MKSISTLFRQLFLIVVLISAFSLSAWGGEYSYTFTSKQFSANETKTLNGVNWTLTGNGGYWGYDGTKGQQFGSGNKPYKSLTLTTSGIEGTIKEITINTSGASSTNASFTVSVGGTQYGSKNLSATATSYTFTGSSSGEIKFAYTQTSSKAIYIKSISVTYLTSSEEIYTVNWYNDAVKTTETYTENSTLDLPTDPTSSDDVYNNFAGWTTTNVSAYKGIINSVEPEYVSETTPVISDMDIYAVFNNATTTTSLVTDAKSLNIGDKIIIAAAQSNVALSTTQNSNNRGQASITKKDDNITFGDDVQLLTLAAGNGSGTFAFYTGNGYLYAASSGSNYLRTETKLSDNSSWSISITSAGIATIKAQGTNTRNWLRHNSTNSLFSCYASGQDDVVIYRVEEKLPTGWTICGDAGAFTDITIENKESITVYKSTNINTLTIKSNLDKAGEVKVTAGDLKANNVVVEKTIGQTWCFFSLPFDCNVADIVATGTNGKLEYAPDASNGDYVIAKYDGTNSWVELIGTSHTLNANQGYIIGHFGSGDVTVKFPSNGTQNISAPANATLAKTSDNGFNLIGLPYYQKTNTSLNVSHLSIPNTDGKTYNQTDDLNLLSSIAPFSSFFVQTEQENIVFTLGEQKNAAPMLRANGITDKAVITLTDANGGEDRTTIINNPNKTTDYEIGHDLTKLIGYASIPQIYSLQGDEMLAFNSLAIDNSTVIPLGVYAHADGEYTFALNEKSLGDLQGWELYDNETGKTTRLAYEDFTIYLEQGTHEGRFEIRLQQRITTNCDNSMGDMMTWTANGTLNINNMPTDAVVYIYDAVGRMVHVATPNTNTFNYSFVARGVYNIVVRSADNTVSFKTIY